MDTETTKLMSDAMKGVTGFVNRQTAMNKLVTEKLLIAESLIIELQNQVKELTKRMEE